MLQQIHFYRFLLKAIFGKILFPHTPEQFSNAYLYVLPSEIEGLPISLLEAMSYGNCVLASDIPENLEALNGHGYTFKSRDIKDLKEALNLLVRRNDLVEGKKEGARRYVTKNHSWDRIVDRYEELYSAVLSGSKEIY